MVALDPESFKLTIEQDFLLARLAQESSEISFDILRSHYLEISRQLLIKDNILKSVLKESI